MGQVAAFSISIVVPNHYVFRALQTPLVNKQFFLWGKNHFPPFSSYRPLSIAFGIIRSRFPKFFTQWIPELSKQIFEASIW
jgi:hypothetical protein